MATLFKKRLRHSDVTGIPRKTPAQQLGLSAMRKSVVTGGRGAARHLNRVRQLYSFIPLSLFSSLRVARCRCFLFFLVFSFLVNIIKNLFLYTSASSEIYIQKIICLYTTTLTKENGGVLNSLLFC